MDRFRGLDNGTEFVCLILDPVALKSDSLNVAMLVGVDRRGKLKRQKMVPVSHVASRRGASLEHDSSKP